MAKLGGYTYPKLKLSRVVTVAKRIADDFKGQVSVSSLATGLDMAERGGAFANLVATLRDYGLVEGRGDLALTPLAESIIFDKDQQALSRAFYNVELYRKLAERIGSDVPADTRLRAVLQEITGENLTTINSRMANIKSVWLDGMQLCGGQTPNAPSFAPKKPQTAPQSSFEPAPGADDTEFAELRIGDSYVRVRRDPRSIEVIVRLLDVLKAELVTEVGSIGRRALAPPSDELSSDVD